MKPVGPIELLQQRHTHISGLLEGSFTVLPEQRNALICGTWRDIECHHAIDGAAVGLSLRGASSVDCDQNSQTQEISNELWPRRPMIAYESHVHLPNRPPFGLPLTQKILCIPRDKRPE